MALQFNNQAIADTIARCAELMTATPEELAAIDRDAARVAWGERLEASGIEAATRAEDRSMLLADRLDAVNYPSLRAAQLWLVKALRRCECSDESRRVERVRCDNPECEGRKPPGRNVLVLAGTTGLGKTLAAAWVISREGGLYVKIDELMRDYARWERDMSQADATTNAWRRYQRAHLVVLDEVGRERRPDLARDAFYKLVDERQSRRRHLTIILTNLSAEDFKERLRAGVYDQRSYSRLARDAWVVDLEGVDRRERQW
jgi:hypothetical protein